MTSTLLPEAKLLPDPVAEPSAKKSPDPEAAFSWLLDEDEEEKVAEDYVIRHQIGRGGDGTVYLAHDVQVGRDVALKLMQSWHGDEETALARFQAEIETVARLEHPNIVPVYGSGNFDSRPFFTMRYLPGGSLAQKISNYDTPRKVVQLLLPIVHAVHHAHQRGILHRDLKPANILLDHDGTPFLGDFGLARQAATTTNFTRTGVVMGTPLYMSPEQASGQRNEITYQTDIFSLGSILFELLTGSPPFSGETSHVVLRQVIDHHPKVPKEVARQAGGDLLTILYKCLEKNPYNRYRTAEDLAADLERWLEGRPIAAQKISLSGRFWRWCKRHPFGSSALALAMVSVLVGTIVSLVLWQKAEAQRGVAESIAYQTTVSSALAARSNFEFGEARALLAATDPEKRDLEWRLVNDLVRGDQLGTFDLPKSAPVNFCLTQGGVPLLFLQDGSLLGFDFDTWQTTKIGQVPELTIASPDPVRLPGRRSFQLSPDGRHAAWIDNRRLGIATFPDLNLVDELELEKNGEFVWLDHDRLIHAVASKYKVKRRSAEIYHLSDGSTFKPDAIGLKAPLAVSPDGTQLALMNQERCAMVVDITPEGIGAEPRFVSEPFGKIATEMSFTPDGQCLGVIVWGSSHRAYLFDLVAKEQIFRQSWPTRLSFLFHPEREEVHLFGREPWFTSWRYRQAAKPPFLYHDGRKEATPHRIDGPRHPPSRLLTRFTATRRTFFYFGHSQPLADAISLPGSKILSASLDGTARLWEDNIDLKNRKTRVYTTDFSLHPRASHNGEWVIFGNIEGGSTVWNHRTNDRYHFPKNHSPMGVLNDGRAFTRDFETGVTYAWQLQEDEKTVPLWSRVIEGDATGGKQVCHIDINADETRISVQKGGRLICFDPLTGNGLTARDQGNTAGATAGQSTSLSPDGQLAVTTGFHGHPTRIYNANDVTAGHRFVEPAEPLTSRDSAAEFSPDGAYLYTGNNDGRVRVYQMPEGRELPWKGWQAHSTEVTAMAVSQDGRYLATSGDGGLVLWKLGVEERRLRIPTGNCNWIQFAANDRKLFHSNPRGCIEVFEMPEE